MLLVPIIRAHLPALATLVTPAVVLFAPAMTSALLARIIALQRQRALIMLGRLRVRAILATLAAASRV
jgi:hypothetical protein